MADYLTTLERTLAGAKETVQVIVPFVDGAGARILSDACSRCSKATRWTLFVRTCPNSLRAEGRRRGWTIYEFVGTPGATDARGFHCKLFIVDGKKAVLGSANLIFTNLAENVELGVFLDDPGEVAPLLAVPRALARLSRAVQY